jgi:DNA-binding winged helix-turn-helix (wHTH) protein
MTATVPPLRSPSDDVRRLCFGEFAADVDESRCHCLYREREPLALSDMPRRVLLALLRERPRPVMAKALLEQLWPAGANPSNLAKQVRTLRRALGDEHGQRYIRTLNKEGYAFVMTVTECPRNAASAPGASALPPLDDGERPTTTHAMLATPVESSSGATTLSLAEWRLAHEKLNKDFLGSCLHDLELLRDAVAECDGRIRMIVERARIPLEGRFPDEPLFVPPRWLRGPSPTPARPDADIAARSAELLRYAEANPIVVNVGAYSTACIAVLQSLQRRYGLRLKSDFEDLSGRQQILRLYHDDQADFLLTPHAPFLLVGDHGALDYRRLTPVYEYSQSVLTVSGRARGRRRRVLVYKGGSPDEQLLVRGAPEGSDPEIVTSLEKLVAHVDELSPGDMVIAWEPLASGLAAKRAFERSADYRLWISLYCHKRWQDGALRALATQFKQLFASEWSFCRSNRRWASECLGVELNALAFFTAGSGLAPHF